MAFERSGWFSQAMPFLVANQDVPDEVLDEAFKAMTSNQMNEFESGVFLAALRVKGESPRELTRSATYLRRQMVKIRSSREPILDTCGTGGDNSGTFNISTATALVLAGAGCSVVKHGNRSVSSRSGSADVLEELGIAIDPGPELSEKCLEEIGFTFCYAPRFHPCLAHIGAVRRLLGFRTIFNLLGPLLNPAGSKCQLIGVGSIELLEPMARACQALGTTHGIIAHGEDGLDEVTLCDTTHIRRIIHGTIKEELWSPGDFGLSSCELSDLRVENAQESAAIILEILRGGAGACERIVVANAAAGLLNVELVSNLKDGVSLARQAIASGAAWQVLEKLRNLKFSLS